MYKLHPLLWAGLLVNLTVAIVPYFFTAVTASTPDLDIEKMRYIHGLSAVGSLIAAYLLAKGKTWATLVGLLASIGLFPLSIIYVVGAAMSARKISQAKQHAKEQEQEQEQETPEA